MNNEYINAFLIGAGISLLYTFRNKKPFDTIWAFVSTFFMILLFILMLGFIGNGVKNWWKK